MSVPSNADRAESIRRATLDDVETLSRIGRATFHETWIEGHRMPYAPDAVVEHLSGNFGEAVVRARLEDPRHAYWLVENDGEAVGYALAGPCTLPYADVGEADGEVKQIYLSRAAQGGGLGARLFDTVTAWLECDGPRRLWLGVWSGNHGAQRFYARRGFAVVGEHVYSVGDTHDREFAMRRG